ncbi:MAG: DUF59 domain-containing protein [Chloroflexi bacterium]|nr:MAG: DUF59 domain-containing protein [Chloroflexota bacterium]
MTQRYWAALAEVEDPEMPVNLVDLGVIYGIAERNGVAARMTEAGRDALEAWGLAV